MSEEPAQQTTRGRWLLLLRVAITVGIFALLFSWLPMRDVWAAMTRTGFTVWFAVILAFGAGHAVAALKWRGLLRAAGISPGILDTIRAHGAGLFANIWLPSIVGGDVIRASWIARRHGLAVPAVAGMVDRILDLLALVILAATGSLLIGDVERDVTGLLRGAAVVLAVGILGGIAVLRWLQPHHIPAVVRGPATKILEVADALFQQPAAAARALTLSLSVQFLFVCLNAALGAAIGIELSLAVWLLVWPLAKIVALAPVSLGGLGVREAALAGLLAPFAVEGSLAVAQALVWQSVLFAFGLVAGASTILVPGKPPSD